MPVTNSPPAEAKRADALATDELVFDLRLLAALIDGAWQERRPGVMALLLEDMLSVATRLRGLARARLPQVMPSDGLMTGQEIALMAGCAIRTVNRSGLPVRALRQSRRGGKPAHLYAVDDVIPWLLARAEGRPLPAGLPGCIVPAGC